MAKDSQWVVAIETDDGNYIKEGTLKQIIDVISDPDITVQDCTIMKGNTIGLEQVVKQAVKHDILDAFEDVTKLSRLKRVGKNIQQEEEQNE